MTLKLQAVSKRLKGELIHPNKRGDLVEIWFSPDGKRLIAGEYPSGVVQLWEVDTRKQLTMIETGYGSQANHAYFQVAPDWQTLYSTWAKSHRKPIEKNGKKLYQYEFKGEVRGCSLESGKIVKSYRHEPPRYHSYMALAPNGQTILCRESIPGVYEHDAKVALSVWDTGTAKSRDLPKDVSGSYGVFSCDSRTLGISDVDALGHSSAHQVFDLDAFKVARTIPITDKYCQATARLFTTDGKTLIGSAIIFPGKKNHKTWKSYLKFWDVATAKEVFSFAGPDKDALSGYVPSPDGKLLALVSGPERTARLLLFDVSGRKLAQTIVLPHQGYAGDPVFSPDGKWLAIATQDVRDDLGIEPDVEDVEQPRIHLIEVATGTVRTTMISPQCNPASLRISPDGRTLASSGLGRVLLWYIADITGAQEQK